MIGVRQVQGIDLLIQHSFGRKITGIRSQEQIHKGRWELFSKFRPITHRRTSFCERKNIEPRNIKHGNPLGRSPSVAFNLTRVAGSTGGFKS